ncbi:multidrug resistance-associated protein 4-like [Anneissia japonica]|uniref:multidrug resistance-associated protein 4-like n=1 Tax=Anneissia japonica TaxID=1529436 RepID=UPI00142590A7|nr:multidrug resistance-associated protein 4-like [Anneissia japonica]
MANNTDDSHPKKPRECPKKEDGNDENFEFDEHPYRNATWLSRLFFCWLTPLFKIGYKRPLEIQDMYPLLDNDKAEHLVDHLSRKWEKEVLQSKSSSYDPSLRWAVARFIWKPLMITALFAFVEEFSRTIQPLFVSYLVMYFTMDSDITTQEAYVYATVIVLFSIVAVTAHHPFFFCSSLLGMRIRVACSGLIYRKALRLSSTALGKTTVGQIVNILSNDVNRFDLAMLFVHYLWIAPLQLIAVTVLLWYEIGPSCFAGVFIVLLMAPLQAWFGTLFAKFRSKTAILTDERIRIMNEIIAGMRVIKMYAWEKPFSYLASECRRPDALRLSSTALGKTTVGQIVNILSNDVNRFDLAMLFVHYLWIAPLQLIAVTVLLWYEIGPSCFAGVFIVLLMAPLQAWFGTLFTKFRSKTAILTDERIRIMNEIIAGMRVIKMYAWEKPFSYLASECRRREIRKIRKTSLLRGSNLAFFYTATSLVSLATFVVYSLTGNTLTASKVYLVIPLYNVVRLSVVIFLPNCVMTLTESLVSLRRIKEFLLLDELDQAALEAQHSNLRPKPEDVQVAAEDVSASWDQVDGENSFTMVLENIDLNVKSGELLAVVGSVGCGKSSLLMAIMGEVPHITGKVKVSGRLAYASQLPWIFSGTVKDNILFGKPYNKQQFDHVVEVCALRRDLDILPNKEYTLVGERGVTLSGGQRARVGLARAVYSDMDIYLLDDPLSAVDTEVGRYLFDVCIRESLKDKPCILVTHQLQYLENVDKILVMKDGQVAGYGTYSELQSSGIDFATLLKEPENKDDVISNQESTTGIMAGSQQFSSTGSLESSKGIDSAAENEGKESKAIGTVSFRVYRRYIGAGGGICFLLLYVLANILVQTLYNASDWWLSYWVYKEETAQEEFDSIDFANSVSKMIIWFLDAWVQFKYCSIGRILNRFAKDIGFMDDLLPLTFADVVQISLMVFGIVTTVVIFNPVVLVFVVPLFVILVFVRTYYLYTSRDVKRMEGITRSPVFSHLSATLQGLSTVRAFQVQQSFKDQFESYQDTHTQAWYMFLATSRYFGIWLDWLSLIFVAVVTYGSVILLHVSENLNSGSAGLSFSYVLSLMGAFQWGVRQTAELENLMTSTERVLEYTDIEPEAPLEREFKPSSDWPKYGIITFEGASLSYFDGGPTVLNRLYCCIRSKEKVGIAGRTGAGKSSLMTALLRLAEPTGKVMIDGVLISDLGLHDLRKSISIIPQDPVLFSGCLRRNLDPFGEHTEIQLWRALEEVQLKSTVSELPEKLGAPVSEGGSNFSVGQRQLLCLARALLRHTRILIVDEATANVDIKTDQLIQATIREKFKHCTVLTIAHRLNTIMDSDRILILDQGKIAEFDEPFVLLQKEDGLLTKMVSESGRAEAVKLIAIAREQYYNNSSDPYGFSDKNISSSPLRKLIPKGVINLTIETNL